MTATTSAALVIDRLGVVYRTGSGGEVVAVADACLHVGPGEICALAGRSGSGKSTLAHAILGMLPASGRITAGTIRLAGVAVERLPEAGWCRLRGRAVSLIPQDPFAALHPQRTAGAQLQETLTVVMGLPRAAARTRARCLLDELGLADPDRILAAYPHQLSGGMAQRVVIALALATEPRLLIADEPTAALDAASAREVLDVLAGRARGRGCSVLLITHDLEASARIADRLTFMERGRIITRSHGRPRDRVAQAPLRQPRAPARPLLQVERLGVWVEQPRGLLGLRSTRRALLADISLDIMPGEALALMGPSGSGKSTLAAALVGLLQPQTGRILFDGRDLMAARRLATAPAGGRELQLVFQDHAGSLDPCWRVDAIVAEPILAHGLAASRAAALAMARGLLADVGLEAHLAGARPMALSGGQRQQVALARALAAKPRLLILDEPTSALDEATRDEILGLLATIRARSGLALLVITHDEVVARRLASRVLILEGGCLREAGMTVRPASRKDPVPA